MLAPLSHIFVKMTRYVSIATPFRVVKINFLDQCAELYSAASISFPRESNAESADGRLGMARTSGDGDYYDWFFNFIVFGKSKLTCNVFMLGYECLNRAKPCTDNLKEVRSAVWNTPLHAICKDEFLGGAEYPGVAY